ncbi:uncharacterized protein UDID_18743 [Ustilago sp. UG-2017a]|nr:uncharacterized protein UDID_18743 [Ustilago sp. UG-2017a]
MAIHKAPMTTNTSLGCISPDVLDDEGGRLEKRHAIPSGQSGRPPAQFIPSSFAETPHHSSDKLEVTGRLLEFQEGWTAAFQDAKAELEDPLVAEGDGGGCHRVCTEGPAHNESGKQASGIDGLIGLVAQITREINRDRGF